MDTDITVTSVVVGSLLPNVIAIVVQPQWRKETRGLVAFGVCVAAGLLIALLQGDIGRGQDVAASVVAVLITSQVLYQALWRPSGIAPAIEGGTSTGKPGRPALVDSHAADLSRRRRPGLDSTGWTGWMH